MNDNADKYREKLSAYFDGHLTPEEMEEIAAHLETCPGCAEELQRLAQLHDMSHEADFGFDSNELDKLEGRINDAIAALPEKEGDAVTGRKKITPIWQRCTALAASIVFVFLIGRMAVKDLDRPFWMGHAHKVVPVKIDSVIIDVSDIGKPPIMSDGEQRDVSEKYDDVTGVVFGEDQPPENSDELNELTMPEPIPEEIPVPELAERKGSETPVVQSKSDSREAVTSEGSQETETVLDYKKESVSKAAGREKVSEVKGQLDRSLSDLGKAIAVMPQADEIEIADTLFDMEQAFIEAMQTRLKRKRNIYSLAETMDSDSVAVLTEVKNRSLFYIGHDPAIDELLARYMNARAAYELYRISPDVVKFSEVDSLRQECFDYLDELKNSEREIKYLADYEKQIKDWQIEP